MINFLLCDCSGCSVPLGMESGKIKDNQISAKTSDSGWEPYEGRLNNDRAWCSEDKEKGQEYFQVDLNRVRHVSEIGIQGVVHLFLKYFVKTYKVKYSFDGRTWYWFKGWDSSADGYTVKVSEIKTLPFLSLGNCEPRLKVIPLPVW